MTAAAVGATVDGLEVTVRVRIESLLFDGTLSPHGGALEANLSRAGFDCNCGATRSPSTR